MENPEKKSPFEKPAEQELEFKPLDRVRLKGKAGREWKILGFSEGHVRLLGPGNPRITEQELREKFERIPEHPLEDLV